MHCERLFSHFLYSGNFCGMLIPGSTIAASSKSRVGFQLMGIFSNANPRYMAVQREYQHTRCRSMPAARTDGGPLPWIHVQIPLAVNDLHALRHFEKMRVLDVLGKHVIEVLAVDAPEFVFGGEAGYGVERRQKPGYRRDSRRERFPVYDVLFALVDGICQGKLVRVAKRPFVFALRELHPKVVVLDHQFFSVFGYFAQRRSGGRMSAIQLAGN